MAETAAPTPSPEIKAPEVPEDDASVEAKQIQQEAEAAMMLLAQQSDSLLMPGPMISLMGSEIFSYTELKETHSKGTPLLR